jgi:hypothetical protein
MLLLGFELFGLQGEMRKYRMLMHIILDITLTFSFAVVIIVLGHT